MSSREIASLCNVLFVVIIMVKSITMGCGASSSAVVPGRRATVYERATRGAADGGAALDAEDRCDSSASIAPFSFGRPSCIGDDPPRIPCLEEEQLAALPDFALWEERKKTRQLYRNVSRGKMRAWAFFNDSLDLMCFAKFIFLSDGMTAMQPESAFIRVLAAEKVCRSQSATEVVFRVAIEPMECLTALEISSAVSDSMFLVVYEAESSSSFESVLAAERRRSQGKLLLDSAAVHDMCQDDKTSSITPDALLRRCAHRNILFVDPEPWDNQPQLGSGGCAPLLRPLYLLLPSESSRVALFRSRQLSSSSIRAALTASSTLLYAVKLLCDAGDALPLLFQAEDAEVGERAVGGYRVTLYDRTMWRRVVVDDWLPVQGGKYTGLSSQNSCEIFPQVLERALAKLVGGYRHLLQVDRAECIELLSGSMCTSLERCWRSAASSAVRQFALAMRLACMVANGNVVTLHRAEDHVRLEAVHIFVEEQLVLLRLSGSHQVSLRSSDAWSQWPHVARVCNVSHAGVEVVELTEALQRYSEPQCVHLYPFWFEYIIRGTFSAIECPSVCCAVRVDVPVTVRLELRCPDARVLLSIWRPSGTAAGRYELLYNSTDDCGEPSRDRFSFQPRRCAAMVEFHPNDGPYIVVPRVLLSEGDASLRPLSPRRAIVSDSIAPNKSSGMQHQGVPFTVTLRSPVPAHASDQYSPVHVDFCTLDSASKLYQNVVECVIGAASRQRTKTHVQHRYKGFIEEHPDVANL